MVDPMKQRAATQIFRSPSLWKDALMAVVAAVLGAAVVAATVVFGLQIEVVDAPAQVAQKPPPPPVVEPPPEMLSTAALAAAQAPAKPAETEKPADCPVLEDAKAPWLVTTAEEPGDAYVEPPSPKSLERRVKFWTKVWGEVPDHVYLLVDMRRPWVVHDQVDCREVWADEALSDAQKKDACGVLLGRGRNAVEKKLRATASSAKLAKQFGGDARLARTASANVIGVEGKKNDLERGMDRAARDLGVAERIFAAHGVPRVFARLGFVESLWRTEAVSRSGAVGTYQFMPATGKEHMRVDDHVDERLDPVRSASAAARYLKGISRQFDGDWALTLTAYNQGPTRVKKLVKAARTKDIGKIADGGDRGAYGFDGQNYYAQMVAVARLTKDLRFDALPQLEKAVVVDEPAPLSKVAACLQRAPDELKKANPALVKDETVPKGYVLAVPKKAVQMAALQETAL